MNCKTVISGLSKRWYLAREFLCRLKNSMQMHRHVNKITYINAIFPHFSHRFNFAIYSIALYGRIFDSVHFFSLLFVGVVGFGQHTAVLLNFHMLSYRNAAFIAMDSLKLCFPLCFLLIASSSFSSTFSFLWFRGSEIPFPFLLLPFLLLFDFRISVSVNTGLLIAPSYSSNDIIFDQFISEWCEYFVALLQ